jgi:16S rRNA processing protein RimM
MQEYLCIGLVAKPQGIRGELKIVPYTDDISRFGSLRRVYFKTKDGYEPHCVVSSRYNDAFAFLSLQSVTDMTSAQRFRNCEVYVCREDAVKLPAGRYFIADLIGCSVTDSNGDTLGVVCDVLQNAGNDVYVVKGARTVLFPAIADLLVKVDVQAEQIIVDAKRLGEVAVYED